MIFAGIANCKLQIAMETGEGGGSGIRNSFTNALCNE
jgi:hypothetical protein